MPHSLLIIPLPKNALQRTKRFSNCSRNTSPCPRTSASPSSTRFTKSSMASSSPITKEPTPTASSSAPPTSPPLEGIALPIPLGQPPSPPPPSQLPRNPAPAGFQKVHFCTPSNRVNHYKSVSKVRRLLEGFASSIPWVEQVPGMP